MYVCMCVCIYIYIYINYVGESGFRARGVSADQGYGQSKRGRSKTHPLRWEASRLGGAPCFIIDIDTPPLRKEDFLSFPFFFQLESLLASLLDKALEQIPPRGNIFRWGCSSLRLRFLDFYSNSSIFFDFHALFQYFLTLGEKSPAKDTTIGLPEVRAAPEVRRSYITIYFTNTHLRITLIHI